MAGNVTVTDYTAFPLHGVRFAWTADVSGAATTTTTVGYHGKVVALVNVPGTPIPTGQYDITIKDFDGYDVLQGNGTNFGNATVEYRASTITSPVFGNLTLAVSNAGNTTQGQCILYIDPLR